MRLRIRPGNSSPLVSIMNLLRAGPKSISEVSEEVKIDWRTAQKYLETLQALKLVKESEDSAEKNKRMFYYDVTHRTYFHLPVRAEHEAVITGLYAQIRQTAERLFGKEPTTSQVYKTLSKLNQRLDLNLPIGWYKFGPCCVQIYEGDENLGGHQFSEDELRTIEDVTKEYCGLRTYHLLSKVYSEHEENLYLAKHQLVNDSRLNNQQWSGLLMELVKHAPKEATELITDFVRAALLRGKTEWNESRLIFEEYVWPYLALLRFRDSLHEYYGDIIDQYLKDEIEFAEWEAKTNIFDTVKNHTDSGN